MGAKVRKSLGRFVNDSWSIIYKIFVSLKTKQNGTQKPSVGHLLNKSHGVVHIWRRRNQVRGLFAKPDSQQI